MIVGGGLAGALMACYLGKAGHEVNVYAVTNNVIRVAPLADMDAAVDELLLAPVDSPFGGGTIIGLPPIAIDGPFMIDSGMGDPGIVVPGMPGMPESDLDSD